MLNNKNMFTYHQEVQNLGIDGKLWYPAIKNENKS